MKYIINIYRQYIYSLLYHYYLFTYNLDKCILYLELYGKCGNEIKKKEVKTKVNQN